MTNPIKNISASYNEMAVSLKSSLWYTISNILIKGISLITVPLFTRLLTEEEYGRISVYYSWKGILYIFFTLYLYLAVYNNAILKYKEKIDEYTSSMMLLIVLITTINFALIFPFRQVLSEKFGLEQSFILIIGLTSVFESAMQFWMARKRFQFEYRSVVFVTVLISILSPLCSIIMVMISDNKVTARIFYGELPTIVIGFWLFILIIIKGRKLYVKEYWSYGLKYNIPLIPHYLSGSILNHADRIMISIMVGEAKAAVYSLSYNAAFMINIVTTAINNSLTPWIYHQMEIKNYNNIRKRSNQILMGIFVLLIMYILCVPEIIIILAPPSYMEAVNLLPILIGSVFFQFLYGFFGAIQFYFEQSKTVMYASVIASGANIILNVIFIDLFGYIAAAYTTLACYIIMSIAHYLFMQRLLKRKKIYEKIYNPKKICCISVALLLVSSLCTLLYPFFIIRYGCIACMIFLIILTREKIMKYIKKL